DELRSEAAALSLFAGEGAVRLLAHDDERGVLLLERALPGTPLAELTDDAEGTRVAARLMRRLWRTPPDAHEFPTLARWFRAFERLREKYGGACGPFPEDLVARAERTFRELNSSRDQTVILHGDLHHTNVLSDERRGWLAIDPKGLCGDPGYEIGSFMLNRLPDARDDGALGDVLNRRLKIFSEELCMSRERLAGWAFCHAMLSALWGEEDSEDWTRAVRLARVLGAL
ncbi:MAG TPA: aminoglycoside phosphotransferase family protein, partial [Pyrinomonadaceae bacterium]|nr:aminoglycoside phosphotransferase family protein [Pyrinomonadaceae bacterium]